MGSGFHVKVVQAAPGPELAQVWHDRIITWYQWVALRLFKMSLGKINLCPKFIVVAKKR